MEVSLKDVRVSGADVLALKGLLAAPEDRGGYDLPEYHALRPPFPVPVARIHVGKRDTYSVTFTADYWPRSRPGAPHARSRKKNPAATRNRGGSFVYVVDAGF